MDMLGLYATDVFNDEVMQQRLPKRIYESLKATIISGRDLDHAIADVVATVMKDWAISKGATHYAHWFHPMTGTTAEKHESFLTPLPGDRAILEFSGKNLVKGEPDASSFPSGGLRETFEARGYTAWDPTSPAFVKDGSLYIPSIFISYTGNVLDKKTPLIRSMNFVSEQGLRILRLFGKDSSQRVVTTLGAEQEYFLIDHKLYKQRKDLIICKRTLFGAQPPKGQEFGDHYFSAIDDRVSAFMKELDLTLWRLGVPAKIKHSEVAPGQFELVPVYDTANIANDQNQLVMACMRQIAPKHGLACLLHEKPFQGINGSGKHLNWSLATDEGQNLLTPGQDPVDNASFVLFVTAMIESVDSYPELLRLVAGSAANDRRLGGAEAPPTIMSIFLGQELTEVLEKICSGGNYVNVDKGTIELGINTLPPLPKDTSDRNRTSPFAFTGDKFEFRMCGSSASVAGPIIALNTAYGQVLKAYADRLEGAEDFWAELNALLAEKLLKHKRIIFNGNNYSQEWEEEAEKRGLPIVPSSLDAFAYYVDPKNLNLFVNNGIYTKQEVYSRMEIHLSEYARTVNIEALTMIEMARKNIVPTVVKYKQKLLDSLVSHKRLGIEPEGQAEWRLAEALSKELDRFLNRLEKLEVAQDQACSEENLDVCSRRYLEEVIPMMDALRRSGDRLEQMVEEKAWGMPSYTAMLLEN